MIELSRLAGWNQTLADWRMLFTLEPQGCFGMEAEGRIVASTTLLCYGRHIAWLGMVLTRPDFRRQGLARQLIARAIERARLLHVGTVKLDATEEGRQLYQSFGFRPERPIERWVRKHTGSNSDVEPMVGFPHGISDLDSAACGYDRSTLIRHLAERSRTTIEPDAYFFCRSGRVNSYVGPFVARKPADARRLISQVIEGNTQAGWAWDLLPQNREAVTLAQSLGFTRDRSLTRMVLGNDLPGRSAWVYAIAGFELG